MSRDTRKLKIKCPESANLKACLDVLQAERIWAMRMNRGAMQSGKRVVQFGVDGMADILAIMPMGRPDYVIGAADMLVAIHQSLQCWGMGGNSRKELWHKFESDFDNQYKGLIDGCRNKALGLMVLWIETKSDTGRQRETQKSFQQWVESHGHVYLLIRNIDELREWLKKNKG